MKIKNYIKTKCGIEKYNFLKNHAKESFIKKVRFFFFTFVAILRDFFKKN